MRASYALPGVFEPVNVGGRWLFDGAIVNPVPVSVARALGAERVIALAIAADGAGRGGTLQEPEPIALPAPEMLPTEDEEKRGWMREALRRPSHWLRRVWDTDEARAPGMASVMVNTFNIAQDRIMRSRLAGDPPDFLLTMKTGRFGLFEFHRAAELIELGRAAVRRSREEILEHLEATERA
jgi:NTE family protein